MLRHEPDESKKFSCDKCDKKFPKKFLLNKHITAVHLNEGQEFLCNICNKKYVWLTRLSILVILQICLIDVSFQF